jgi:MFS family permease
MDRMSQQNAKSAGSVQNLKHMLRALRGRNYAMFFVGQGLSLIGMWMQSVALGLLVWKMTHKEMSLGLVGFASQIFGFALTPFAGVFSDRWNRHRVLLATQAMAMLQAILLAALTLTGVVHLWHVIALAAFLGLVSALDMPTRQAFVVQMVARREDLPNAIALNSFIFNGARLVGPFIAAMIIPLIGGRFAFAYAGEGACFAINAMSYLAVIAALLAMRLPPWRPSPNQQHVLHSLKEGFRYSFGFAPIRMILLMLGLICFVAMPYSVLLPAIAAKSLHAGRVEIPLLCLGKHCIMLKYENTVGILVSSAGMGALLGALLLASRKSIAGLGRLIAIAMAVLGVGMIGFALSKYVWLSMPLLVLIGFGFMLQMASSNTILQTIVDDDKRGRVMSFYTMSFLGTAPFGALLAGSLATHIGAPMTILLSGVIAILGSIVFALRLPLLLKHMRPIYVKMGIISDTPPIPKAAAEADIQNHREG